MAMPIQPDSSQPTHWRAITLRQLKEVVAIIRQRCEREKWLSTLDRTTLLTPETVTLYDLNYYVILPSTVPDGVRITGLPPRSYAEGEEVRQEGKGKGYVQKTVTNSTEVQVRMTEGRFESGHKVMIGADGDFFVSCAAPRVSFDSHLSYVGHLTEKAQKPVWFVSHWWGERVLEFVECVRSHAELHHLGEDTPYWVCAYANDQHHLGCDVSEDPRETSFFRALTGEWCAGVLLVLNGSEGYEQAAVALRRVWCIYEIFLAFSLGEGQAIKRFEIATCSADGKPQVITHGLTESEQADEQILPGSGWENKMCREQRFPINVLAEGTTIQVQRAEASQPQDRQHILNAISGSPLNAHPLEEHASYEQVNQKLRGLTAVVAWPQAVCQGKVSQLNLPAALKADSKCKDLCMSFSCAGEVVDSSSGQSVMDDSQLRLLAEHLPANLSGSITLDFSYCTRIGSEGVGALGDALSRYTTLAALSLDFSDSNLDRHGMQALGLSICRLAGLKSLEFKCRACDRITDDALQELLAGVESLSQLETLIIDFEFCVGVADRSLAAMGTCLRELGKSLTNVKLDFTHCRRITDKGISEFSDGLKILPNLVKLSLSFHGCNKMTKLGAEALGSGVGLPRRLANLYLSLEMTTSVEKAGIMSIVQGARKLEHLTQITFIFTAATGKAEHIDSIASLQKDLPGELWTEAKLDAVPPSTAESEQHSGRLSMRRVLVLTDFNFWDTEYHQTRSFLEAEGADVRVAAKYAPGTELIGQEAGMRCTVDYQIDMLFEQGHHRRFDAVFVPGGAAPQALRHNEAAQKIIAWMVREGRVAAAICHGVKTLGAAGVLDGMRCTSYLGIKLAVESYGGLWSDREVAVDEQSGGAVVTSRTPPDLPAFCEAIAAEMQKRIQASEPLRL